MKLRLIMSAVLVLFFCSSIFPQEINDESTHKLNALNFYIINGYAVSYKFKNDSDIKYRIHLDLSSSFSKSKLDQDNDSESGNSIDKYSRDGDEKGIDLYLSIRLYFALFNFTIHNLFFTVYHDNPAF